ncbi:MAG TPA: head decoration protein [Cyclobacteriaceae bacterium]|jgi:hypothetical protein|nr:head decoration protein [Cyclobacteriaceae bacterium]
MSNVTQTLQTNNQLTNNYDVSKIFVWQNRFNDASYTNGGGAPVTLVAGTVMGRITATGLVVPLVSTAVDGSQIPVGILNQDVVVAPGATMNVSLCNQGDVVESLLTFSNGTDTMDTTVSGRKLRDHVQAQGIHLVGGTDLTGFDN